MSLDLSLSSAAEEEPYDVIVIGGGPAGSTAAIYAARADLRTLVLDKGITAGALGMASKIANYPGMPETISGAELVARMREQAASFGADVLIDKVLRVDLRKDPKEVWGGEKMYRGRVVIVATGSMGRTRYLPGEEALIGRGVAYCATCDAAFFRGRDVAVVGNNDEAVDEALTLTRFASHVHLFSPGSELRASEELVQDVMEHADVTVHLSTPVREIVGEKKVEGVRFTSEGEEHVLPVAGAFVYLQGNQPVTDFLFGQLPTGEDGCVLVDGDYQTTVSGVFAVGDVVCGHLRQATTSAAEGVTAAMAADRYLRGRKKLRPDWH